MDSESDLHLDTLLQHFAEEDKPHGAVVPPIFQNSLFVFPDYDSFSNAYNISPAGPPYHYSRLGNPSLHVVERKLSVLEGTESAKVFAGGMAAISTAVMSTVEAGSHVLVTDSVYTPARSMFEEYLPKFGVEATFVDMRCVEAVADRIRPETSLIYLESPSSFVFRIQDLEAIARIAKEKGITTICDNSYATPLFQTPAQYGIDMVVHSATKYLSGHSDQTAGVICTSQERVDRMLRREINIFASLLNPFGAWLLLRGMRTLSVRMKAHREGGNAVAEFLEVQPEVERVFHLGLPSHPQHELYKRQMKGSTALLSYQPVNQDPEYLKRLVNAHKIFQIGVSWGGFESLVVPMEVKPMDWTESRYLIRYHVGLEDVRDLLVDIRQALDAAASA